MSEPDAGQVLVQVVQVDEGRQIGWGSNLTERLNARLEDVQTAITSGAQAVAGGLPGLPHVSDWRVREVTGTFGLSLTAEAGVILSRASTEATFEVSVTFERTDRSS